MEKYKAGMFVYALAFLLGVTLVQQLSVLPETFQLSLLLLSVPGLYLILSCSEHVLKYQFHSIDYRLIRCLILLFIIGIIYASLYADYRLKDRLDESYSGHSILISGRVSNIPVTTGSAQRFEFNVAGHRFVEQKRNSSDVAVSSDFPRKLRLNWYYGHVNAGEKWQLEVRLKPPHGFMNPGGFDYEGWLFQHGIQATGYVRKSTLNKKIQNVDRWSIIKLRQSLSQQLDQPDDIKPEEDTTMSLVKALAIGDKSSITPAQWRVLANTGISHLMAISGLHIGLAALFSYLLIRRLTPVAVMKYLPAQHVALIGSMLCALLYAMIAGFSIPTQRAFIMLFVLSVMMLLRWNNRPVDSLGFALFVVLLLDPLAVLSAGFWFSFSAVAVIFISVVNSVIDSAEEVTLINRMVCWLKRWFMLQLSISFFLLPLSLFMFQQVSLVSPLVNLLLIPYVSFLVVPVVLIAIVFSSVLPDLSTQLFNLASMLLDLVWPALSYLSKQPYALWVQGDVRLLELLLAVVAMLMIFFARQCLHSLVTVYPKIKAIGTVGMTALWAFRCLSCLLMIPLFASDRQLLDSGEFQLTVLDVGQGSAAVIQTQNHVAVFDTGAKFSDKLDAGSGVVIPYLRSQGISKLDRLIISHGDADHIGGAPAILEYFPAIDIIGQDIDDLATDNKRACIEGDHWRWDNVDFRFISPESGVLAPLARNKRNNRSCVLRVSSPSGSALLTGDIEKEIERKLTEKYADRLSSDVLIVPHHGSNTSSSQAFIRAVSPEISIISAGYKNRYRLPSKRVVSRYQRSNLKVMKTDENGAIIIRAERPGGLSVVPYRQTRQRYWHHRL